MKINTKTAILNLDGSPVKVSEQEIFTVGHAISQALLGGPYPNDNPSAEEKLSRFRLALKLQEDSVNLVDSESVLARKIVGLSYAPLVVGRVNEILDQQHSVCAGD